MSHSLCLFDALLVHIWCMVDSIIDGTVEVHFGAWLMHFFMVQVDYRLFGTGWFMVDALVYGTG